MILDSINGPSQDLILNEEESFKKLAASFFTEKMTDLDKEAIVKACRKIGIQDGVDVRNKVLPCITKEMNGFCVKNMLKTVHQSVVAARLYAEKKAEENRLAAEKKAKEDKLDAEKKAEGLCAHALNLVDDEKEAILGTISHINKDRRPSVIQNSAPLFTEDMDGIGRVAILTTVYQIGDAFSASNELARPFFTAQMTGESKAIILKTCHEIVKNYWHDIRDWALALYITEKKDGSSVKNIFKDVHNELLVDWSDAFEKAKGVITSRMDDSGKATIFRAIRHINKDRRPFVIEMSTPLFTENMSATGRADVLKAVNEIVIEAGNKVSKVITLAAPLFTAKMTGESRAVILKTFYKIGKDASPDVREKALPFLTKEMDGPRVASILEAIHSTGEDRQDILDISKLLLGERLDQIDGYAIANTIKIVRTVDQSVRRNDLRIAQTLYPACNANNCERLDIFQAVTKIEGNKVTAAANTNKLVTPGMNGAGIIKLLDAVAKCGAMAADEVTTWALSFLNEGMRSVCDREAIVNTVREVILHYFNWKEIFDSAKSKITDTMGASDITKILKEEAAAIGPHFSNDVEVITERVEKITI